MTPIRHLDADGDLLVRDGLIVAFFAQRPFADLAAGVGAIFDEWLKALPPDTLQWASVGSGADNLSEYTKKTLGRCRDQIDPAKAAKRSLSAFTLQGPEAINPAFRFEVSGNLDPKSGNVNKNNMVEVRFPTEFAAKSGFADFSEMVVRMAAAVPFDSGYASLALNFGSQVLLPQAAPIMAPLAMRHPGFDLHYNDLTRYQLGIRSRGARWLTLLGPRVLKKLGKPATWQKALTSGIDVLPAGDGLLLRAGPEPLPGDVNRKDNLPLLRAVAKAIEPVTCFDDNTVQRRFFRTEPDMADRWNRRFLD
jgi:hypothetical protein